MSLNPDEFCRCKKNTGKENTGHVIVIVLIKKNVFIWKGLSNKFKLHA